MVLHGCIKLESLQASSEVNKRLSDTYNLVLRLRDHLGLVLEPRAKVRSLVSVIRQVR